MLGTPADFEAIGSRLGFRIVEDTPQRMRLIWRGPRFPAFLCLGIAVLLLGISLPIGQAIHLRGFSGPAGPLWYFPLMNLILFGIAVYLLSQKRVIVIDSSKRELSLMRRSLLRKIQLLIRYDEITKIQLGVDQVYSGFAVAGSSAAAESFPIPALRVTTAADSILLDRGSRRKLEDLGRRISERLNKRLEIADSV